MLVVLLASQDSLVSLVRVRSSVNAEKINIMTTLAPILVHIIPPSIILMLTPTVKAYSLPYGYIPFTNGYQLKAEPPRTHSLYILGFCVYIFYNHNYLWSFNSCVSQKPHEHHGHVILDSALGRCKTQAGLNGTEDTR